MKQGKVYKVHPRATKASAIKVNMTNCINMSMVGN